MSRDTCATSRENRDIVASHIPSDDPQLMLVVAHTRLFLMPERSDGSKFTTIASYGAHDLRLAMLPPAMSNWPLWIELYDHRAGLVIDSVGCWDLDQAQTAVEAFIAEALRRNGGGGGARPPYQAPRCDG